MARELKPCPFCGSPAAGVEDGSPYCDNDACGASQGLFTLEEWNRRAEVSEGPTTAGPMPEILGMRVVEDAQVPLGEARIVAPDGTCVATLDLIYGGYTIHRAAGMKGGN